MPSPAKTQEMIDDAIDEAVGLGAQVGNYFYVDSTSTNKEDSASHGTSPESPFATLDYAIAATTANNGDIIFVAAAHAETLTATTVAIDVAGLTIYGLGVNRTRPTFTVNGAIDGFTVTAANTLIKNIRFAASGSSSGVTARIDLGATDCTVDNCEFLCGADDLLTITIPDAGDRSTIRNCTFRISANGPDSAIKIESASTDGVTIENCWADGGSATNQWDDALIHSTVACTNTVFRGSIDTTFGTAVSLTAASYTHYLPDGSVMVNRATASLPASTAAAIFAIAGYVSVLGLYGEVTTVIQTQANNTKLSHNPTGTGSTVDICAVLDITADAVGTVYSIVGVLATALKSTTLWAVVPADNIPRPGVLLGTGDIELNCAATNTGSVRWICHYLPVAGGNLRVA